MVKKTTKKDINQLAKTIVDIATKQASSEKRTPSKKKTKTTKKKDI